MAMGAGGGAWFTSVFAGAEQVGVPLSGAPSLFLGGPGATSAWAAATGWCALGLVAGAALAGLGFWLARGPSSRHARSEREAETLAGLDRLASLSEVVRLVAHGVRNSLSVVVSCASLLEKDRPPQQRRELLAALGEEGDRMRELVDQLTALAGDGTLESAPIDVDELLQTVVERAGAHPDRRPGVLIAALPTDTALVVHGDRVRLESALGHLLLCALDSGASSVRVQAAADPDGASRFTVECTGGHAPDSLLAGGHENPEPELLRTGPWLWLAVTRRVVRAHHGRLDVGKDAQGALRASLVFPAA